MTDEDVTCVLQFLNAYKLDQSDNIDVNTVEWIIDVIKYQEDKIIRHVMMLGFELGDCYAGLRSEL